MLHLLRHLHGYLPQSGRRRLLRHVFGALFSLPSLAEARALGADAPPACKTVESRVAGLALLADLAEQINGDTERAEVIELLLRLQEQRGGASTPRALWHYMPSAMERARCGYVGLKNLGATCYLNALAQQLYMIPEFRQGIIELPMSDAPVRPKRPNHAGRLCPRKITCCSMLADPAARQGLECAQPRLPRAAAAYVRLPAREPEKVF